MADHYIFTSIKFGEKEKDMKRALLVMMMVFCWVLNSGIVNAAESCDDAGNCVTCDRNGDCSWNAPILENHELRITGLEVRSPKDIHHGGFVTIGGGFLYFSQAKEGLSLGLVTAGYRFLYDAGEPGDTLVGFELKLGGGMANEYAATVTTGGNFVLYVHKHFGMAVGYSYFHVWNVGKEDPIAAHYAQFALRVPTVKFCELEFYGMAGWGEYHTSEINPYEDMTTGQVFQLKTHKTSSGTVYGGGGKVIWRF